VGRRAIQGAVIVDPGGGRRTGNVEFLALSEDTGRFNLALITIESGRPGPPPHVHRDEEDSFYILEGELTFLLGDSEEEVAAPAGTFVLVPSGLRHSFVNRSASPTRILNVHAPAGFDRRLLENG